MYITEWSSKGAGLDDFDIILRIYDIDFNAVTSELIVNTEYVVGE